MGEKNSLYYNFMTVFFFCHIHAMKLSLFSNIPVIKRLHNLPEFNINGRSL